MECIKQLLIAAVCLLATSSCSQTAAGSRTYPDAVVSLRQVDPVYRPYFAAQNGANYSLADQRAAFIKAAQTARGPMPHYVASSPRSAKRGKAAPSKTAKRGKVTRKAPARKTPAKKRRR